MVSLVPSGKNYANHGHTEPLGAPIDTYTDDLTPKSWIKEPTGI